MKGLVVYAADVGSVSKKNFGWARRGPTGRLTDGTDISKMAKSICGDLKKGHRIALGFECPLFVPVPKDPADLLKARSGEGNRSWSAPAGAGSLVAGMAESTWLLREIAVARPVTTVTVIPEVLRNGGSDVLLWEAFISGKRCSRAIGKNNHVRDARTAVKRFWNSFRRGEVISKVSCENPFSLIAAVADFAGLKLLDKKPLSEACFVVS